MPELPEVEVCRRQLERWAAGSRVAGVRVLDPSVFRATLAAVPDPEAALSAIVGAEAGRPRRRGKRLLWPFGRVALLLHLGMTGRWVRRTDPEPPEPHARLRLAVGSHHLWFVDPRRFGAVALVAAPRAHAALVEGLGPDALDQAPDPRAMAALLGGSRRAIKVVLLDQGRLAGVGNIHAAEALWRAGIDPRRPAADLDDGAWARLAAALPAQLREAIAEADADEVRYLSDGADNPFAVYGRAGEPCPRCGRAVERTSLGGRATFSCPACQPPAG